MNEFSVATDTLFASAIAQDATYRSVDPTVGEKAVRVVLAQPDDLVRLDRGEVVSDTTRIDVRVSEITAPVAGDVFTVGDEEYVVQGTPRRDARRLRWRLDCYLKDAS